MLPDSAVSDWCAAALGAPLDRVVFRTGHLAQVLGADLSDGRQAVIKVRPAEPRIVGCVAVQAHLAAAGFPGPAPLAGPDRIGSLSVTAEVLVPAGTQLAAGCAVREAAGAADVAGTVGGPGAGARAGAAVVWLGPPGPAAVAGRRR